MTKGALLRSFVHLTKEIDDALEKVGKRALDREIPARIFGAIAERQQVALAYILLDAEEVAKRAEQLRLIQEKQGRDNSY